MGYQANGPDHVFTCDLCGDKVEVEGMDKSQAIEWMKKAGWVRKGKAFHCPDKRKHPKK